MQRLNNCASVVSATKKQATSNAENTMRFILGLLQRFVNKWCFRNSPKNYGLTAIMSTRCRKIYDFCGWFFDTPPGTSQDDEVAEKGNGSAGSLVPQGGSKNATIGPSWPMAPTIPASRWIATSQIQIVRSCSSSHRFRQTPPPYPLSDPSLQTTRWQGMTMAMRLSPLARPTARQAFGRPIAAAIDS